MGFQETQDNPEFLASIRADREEFERRNNTTALSAAADDAELAKSMAGGLPMFGVVSMGANGGQPLALFATEHDAWRWLFDSCRSNAQRGKFGPYPENLRVRSFTVLTAEPPI